MFDHIAPWKIITGSIAIVITGCIIGAAIANEFIDWWVNRDIKELSVIPTEEELRERRKRQGFVAATRPKR